MLIFNYKDKDDLLASIGRRLLFTETSIPDMSYTDDGELIANNNPTEDSRFYFKARVTMAKGIIEAVEIIEPLKTMKKEIEINNKQDFILVCIDKDITFEDGDAFDAVLGALEFCEIPAYIEKIKTT